MCGNYDAGTDGDNAFVAHYSTTGALINRYDLPGSTGVDERCEAIAVGPDGNVVFGGELGSFPTKDMWVRKLAPNGTELWSMTRDGGGGGNDDVRAIAIDSDDAVWLCGRESVAGEGQNIYIAKYLPG